MPSSVDILKDFIPDLQEVAQKMTRTPKRREYNKLGKYNSQVAVSKIGSWKKVLELAGLKEETRKKKYTQEELLEDLKKVIQIYKRQITYEEYKQHGGIHSNKTFCIRFASKNGKEDGWSRANIQGLIGLDIQSEKTNEEIIDAVKTFTTEIRRTPTRDEICKEFPFITRATISEKFENYNGLLTAANIPINKHTVLSKEQIIQDFKKLADLLGKTPEKNDFDSAQYLPYTSKPIYRLFGSLGNLIEAAGFERPISKDTPTEKLYEEIDDVYKIVGCSPSVEDMELHGKSNPSTLMKREGKNWNEILITRGYPPNLSGKNSWRGADGEIYESKGETSIANTLFEFKEKTGINYLNHCLICNERKWTVDFKIVIDGKEIFIEYDGYGLKRPHKTYADPENEKISTYKQKSLNLWIVSPEKYKPAYGEIITYLSLRQRLGLPTLAKYLKIDNVSQVCYQKIIKNNEAIKENRKQISNLKGCIVKEITRDEAKPLILKYEWLGTMGKGGKAYYGLFSQDQELLAAVCFGNPPYRTNIEKMCGPITKLVCLQRGANVPWSPKNSASYLISQATRQSYKKYGWNTFIAYSDESAKEIGTVYQASNWKYLGQGLGRKNKDREEYIVENIKTLSSKAMRNRYQSKENCLAEGGIPIKKAAKHVYAYFEGSRNLRRKLRKLCKYIFIAYPKRTKIE